MAQIAAYLLQREIVGAPEKIEQYFSEIYGNAVGEPGREWPPQLPKVARFQRSEYPTFSNVLLHVNGAKLEEIPAGPGVDVANLVFDPQSSTLNFSVITVSTELTVHISRFVFFVRNSRSKVGHTRRDFYRFGPARRAASTSGTNIHRREFLSEKG